MHNQHILKYSIMNTILPFKKPFIYLDGPWCQLAYWEGQNRVGSTVSCSEPWVDVFGNEEYLQRGSGSKQSVCLAKIVKGNPTCSSDIEKARSKIGAG
jgi:hypothetical protein